MKKLLMALSVVSMMSINAIAGVYTDATLDSVKFKIDGSLLVVVTPNGGGTAALLTLSDSASTDTQKAFTAALLTAKSSGSTITIKYSSGSITEITL